MKNDKLFVADFETITTEPTRVWLWAICNINDYKNYIYGTDIDSFMLEISKPMYNKSIIYFHNLRFDGNFICYWLLNNPQFEQILEGKLHSYSYSTLISRMNQWYQIKIMFKHTKVTLQDSLKKLPFSVKDLAVNFHLEMTKGEINYDFERPYGYQPTNEELDYISRDIGIVAQALKIQIDNGLTKMTIGADALNEYKNLIQKFRDVYPELDLSCDDFCRKSYKGGYCYVNPIHQNVIIDSPGQVLDVNSMYPWAMHEMPLPYGTPIYYTGKYVYNSDYPLYISHLIADFDIKDNKFPTIQVKGNNRFLAREYIKDSLGHMELYLTSVDLELFIDAYNIYDINYIDGYMFKSTTNAFKMYIDKWIKVKQENTGALRTLAKLMLNSLYGKFAKNPDTTGRHPILVDDKVRLELNKPEISSTNYIPVGCFVTAWARWNLITSINVCGERFCYCDTDSIHIIGLEPVKGLKVHPTELGSWKQEMVFKRAKYLHTKCYIEEYENKGKNELKVTVAGMPSYCRSQVTFDNFKAGAVFDGKLLQHNVKGGVILVPTNFTIKDFEGGES